MYFIPSIHAAVAENQKLRPSATTINNEREMTDNQNTSVRHGDRRRKRAQNLRSRGRSQNTARVTVN